MRLRGTLAQRNALSLTVASAATLTAGSAGAVGIALTRLGGLFDALVGETIADIGFAVFARPPTAIGAVLALGGWVLANAILANKAFSTVAFGRAVGVGHLAAAVDAILTGGAGGGIATTRLTKTGVGTVGICCAIGILKALELTDADTLIEVWIRAVAHGGAGNIAAIVGNLIRRDGRSLFTGQKTHEKCA